MKDRKLLLFLSLSIISSLAVLNVTKRYSVWIILFRSLMDIVWHWDEPQEQTVN
ncbi:hypothetical protein [Enterococcus hirae]|uniref:hypothetical protein n=1 Tax=Enterococcus hirae TaxID=1354 RepID=UPI001C4D7DEA|nr:hypothetical protein [Enterococcus hirae]